MIIPQKSPSWLIGKIPTLLQQTYSGFWKLGLWFDEKENDLDDKKKIRISLAPGNYTNLHNRTESFHIYGGSSVAKDGDISLGDKMDEFAKTIIERVPKGEQIELRVQYRPFYEISRYQDKDFKSTGNWTDLQQKSKGQHVLNLQNDLFALGYWVTSGKEKPTVNQPATFNSSFDAYLYSAVKTFQFEHKNEGKLSATGTLDKKTADFIVNILSDGKNWKNGEIDYCRPGIPVNLTSLTKDHFCKYAISKPTRPTRFYQLPPSKNGYWYRYGDVIYTRSSGDLEDCYHNEIWGAKETIDALINLCTQWTSKHPDDPVEIGDISKWTGGKLSPHGTHQDGYGIDLRTNKTGKMDSTSYKFDKDLSVKFAKIARKYKFGRIITKCPHVAIMCNDDKLSNFTPESYVTLIESHQHHWHIDYWHNGCYLEPHLERAYCKNCIIQSTCNSEHKNL